MRGARPPGRTAGSLGGLVSSSSTNDRDKLDTTLDAAVEWYESPGYQAILPLRTANTESIATLVDGVPAGYQATPGLAKLLAAESA
jgi:Domain of unknown function (DUF1330)